LRSAPSFFPNACIFRFSPNFSLTFRLNILKLEASEISKASSSALDLAKALNARLRTQTNLTFSQDKLTFKPPTELTTRDALIGHLILKKNLRLDLSSATINDHFSFTAHTNAVAALAPLRNDRIATGSWDSSIKIWECMSGVQVLTLTGHTDAVCALDVMRGGDGEELLVSGSWDESVRVWQVASGRLKLTFSGHTDCVYAVACLGQSEVASGSADKTVKVFNVNTGVCR